jgi:hypothetical protein
MRWAAAAATLGLTFACASAQDAAHPNERIYEYRVLDYRLQPGWKTYPQGTDRAQWVCFDDKAGQEIWCAEARQPLQEYRFIFRVDPDKRPRRGTGGLY